MRHAIAKPGPESGPGFFMFKVWYLGGVPREQKMLKGHLPRVMHHQVYEEKLLYPF